MGDVVLWVSTGSALVVAVAGLFKDRWVPKLTKAQADTEVISQDQLRAEVKRLNEEGNIWRDLRILDLERWGDAMRPYLSARDRRDDQMVELIREERARCNLPMPEIEPIPPAPPYPEPRPRPA